jgi:hypothetical protein
MQLLTWYKWPRQLVSSNAARVVYLSLPSWDAAGIMQAEQVRHCMHEWRLFYLERDPQRERRDGRGRLHQSAE